MLQQKRLLNLITFVFATRNAPDTRLPSNMASCEVRRWMPLHRPDLNQRWRCHSNMVASCKETISRSSLVDSSATDQCGALYSSHNSKQLRRIDISGSDHHFHRCAANRIYASILARENAPRGSSHFSYGDFLLLSKASKLAKRIVRRSFGPTITFAVFSPSVSPAPLIHRL
jgi:hypothetical protein